MNDYDVKSTEWVENATAALSVVLKDHDTVEPELFVFAMAIPGTRLFLRHAEHAALNRCCPTRGAMGYLLGQPNTIADRGVDF
jgi:hypothetical protein